MKNLLTATSLMFAVALTLGCETTEKTEDTAAMQPADTSSVYVEPLVLDDQGNVVNEKKDKHFWDGWFKSDKKDNEVAMADEDKGWSLFGKKKHDKHDDQLTADEVLGDLSPELKGLAETPDEFRIRKARTLDTDWRALNDDVLKVLYLDRPKRIGVMPIP
ncbi:MAG: hypothetical protein GC159_18205 [Phycisphaera sp.]|nr:hypothetical protein [Phycisphaera sp.]